MPGTESNAGPRLQHFCDMELENRQGAARAFPDRGRLGEYLGSGEGAVFGQAVNGTVLWDLFQEQGEFVCEANLRGIIKVDDGAQITFEAIGHLIRPEMSKPTEWFMTSSVRFKSDARHFYKLNSLLAILHGKYDMGINRHSYHIFTQVVD